MKIFWSLKRLVFCSLFFTVSASAVCPDSLKWMKTKYLPTDESDLYRLCQFWESATQKHLVGEILNHVELTTPRLIPIAHWNSVKQSCQNNPALVYQPAPETWDSWVKSAGDI